MWNNDLLSCSVSGIHELSPDYEGQSKAECLSFLHLSSPSYGFLRRASGVLFRKDRKIRDRPMPCSATTRASANPRTGPQKPNHRENLEGSKNEQICGSSEDARGTAKPSPHVL